MITIRETKLVNPDQHCYINKVILLMDTMYEEDDNENAEEDAIVRIANENGIKGYPVISEGEIVDLYFDEDELEYGSAGTITISDCDFENKIHLVICRLSSPNEKLSESSLDVDLIRETLDLYQSYLVYKLNLISTKAITGIKPVTEANAPIRRMNLFKHKLVK